MSGGAGETGSRNPSRDEDELKRSSGGSAAEKFSRAIARIAVSQICESAGFQGFQESALDALTDVGIRYLRDLGETAHSNANSAGRTDCNVFDVVQGLEDLNLCWGFLGASDVNRCLVGSGVVREIRRFVGSAEEIPFARPVPRFPVIKSRKPTPSFAQIGETPIGNHIPDWLPAFPDPHTYPHTPIPSFNEKASDPPRIDNVQETREQRKAERSLLSLQQQLACNGTVGQSSKDATHGGLKTKGVSDSNPFLARPLQFGEKDVSAVAVPANLSNQTVVKNPVSVFEAFAPAIEAVRNGHCELGYNEKRVLPNKRPTVHFSFGIDKKSVGVPLGLNARNSDDVENVASWFSRDEERDDKKRRAEQILKESMENSQELGQL